MQNLSRLESIFSTAVPKVLKQLLKVYGQDVKIYRVKHKKLPNTIQGAYQTMNEFSQEIYQDNSLLANDISIPSEEDLSDSDYINEDNLVTQDLALLTSISFENYNGQIVGGGEEDLNCYMLNFTLQKNDIIVTTRTEGGGTLEKRYKVLRIESIGETASVIKRAVLTNLFI